MKKEFDDTQEFIPNEIWSDDRDKQIEILRFKIEKVNKKANKFYRTKSLIEVSLDDFLIDPRLNDKIIIVVDVRNAEQLKDVSIMILKRSFYAIGLLILGAWSIFGDKIKSWLHF